MYATENIDNPLYELRRLFGSSGSLTFSNVKQWQNKAVFRDISIKYVLKGREFYYDSTGMQHIVDEGQFLMGHFEQNSGESMVNSPSFVEGICLYIKHETINEVYSALCNQEKFEGDNFRRSCLIRPEFFNDTFSAKHSPLNDPLKKFAVWFYNRESLLPENLFNEFLIEAAEKIVLLQYGIHESMTRLDFLKDKTRREIIRRLLVAKAYIDENYLANPSLDQLSSFCGLSKYHFLRCFQQAYRQSPFEYVQSKRLEYAKRVLQNKHSVIKDIASQCSFSDLAAFSKAFKRKFGVPPSAVQKAVQPTCFFLWKDL